jgi:hypothetical protein
MNCESPDRRTLAALHHHANIGGAHPVTLLARTNLTSAYEADGRWN